MKGFKIVKLSHDKRDLHKANYLIHKLKLDLINTQHSLANLKSELDRTESAMQNFDSVNTALRTVSLKGVSRLKPSSYPTPNIFQKKLIRSDPFKSVKRDDHKLVFMTK